MMEDGPQFIWIALVLLMVSSALVARRVPIARLVAWSAGWAILFLAVYYLFTMIEPRIATWQQARRGGEVQSVGDGRMTGGPVIPGNASGTSGTGVSIAMRGDGHYWVDAMVNGRTVRFLIDSGASITAVSQATADMLGLEHDPMNRTVVMQTANGEVAAARSIIPIMQVGTIQASDLPVVVSASFGNTNVLGMNFLNKLKSWRVEDGNMVLEPR